MLRLQAGKPVAGASGARRRRRGRQPFQRGRRTACPRPGASADEDGVDAGLDEEVDVRDQKSHSYGFGVQALTVKL